MLLLKKIIVHCNHCSGLITSLFSILIHTFAYLLTIQIPGVTIETNDTSHNTEDIHNILINPYQHLVLSSSPVL